MKKFELTSETKVVLEKNLYRIRALTSFADVQAGQLGGWIEKEDNLSQNGNAWVYGNAWVDGDARVYGNARVYGDAQVGGDAEITKRTHLLEIGFIGSRDAVTTFFRTMDKQIYVRCGCFSGNLDEFAAAVAETHGESKHGKVYKLAIEMAKMQIEDVDGGAENAAD